MDPLAYGIGWNEAMKDHTLNSKQGSLVIYVACVLDKAKFICFNEKNDNFYCTELGCIASHFYNQYSNFETYKRILKHHMNDHEVVDMITHSSEFQNIIV